MLAGNKGLTKAGTGVLELSGANTYSGTTTITTGDLRAIDGVGLPSGSPLLLNASGATFQSSGTFTRALGTGAGQVRLANGGFSAFGGPLAVQIGGNTGTLTFNSTPNFVTSTLILSSASADSLVDFQNGLNLNAGTRTVNVVDNPSSTSDLAQISGPISGSNAPLGKQGTGTLILTGANSYGNTLVSGGSLQIGNGGTTGTLGAGSVSVLANTTLAFNRSNALSITNTFAPSTNGSIAQNGTGTTTLSGNMGSYTGNVQVNRGTLVLSYGTNNTSKVGDSAVLTIGSAALQLAGGSHLEVVGSTTINGAASISRSSGTATLQLNTITIVPGAALDVGQDSIATTDNRNVNNVLAGVTVNGTLAKNATNADDGNIIALVAGDYTPVNRLGGTIADGSATNVKIVNAGSSGPATLASAVTTINTLTQAATDGPATVDLQSNTLRLGASGTILVPSGSGALTFNNGTLTAGGADNTAGTITINHLADVTVNSTITDNGSGAVGLIKVGAGQLTLTANNTYSGITAIGGGTLVVGAGGPTGTLGSGSISNNSALVFNRTGTMTVGNAIAGGGTLTQAGPGNAILTAANNYTGGTTVSGGRLSVNGSILGSVNINSGGTLGGTGIANGAISVNAGGSLAPGNSIGTLNSGSVLFTNLLNTQASASTFQPELDFAGPGNADLLNVTGSVTINNAILDLSFLNIAAYTSPMTFLIVQNDDVDAVLGGGFGYILNPAGYAATVNYTFTGPDSIGRIGTGNDVAVTITAIPTPEPSAFVLGGFGLLALIFIARRKHFKRAGV